MRRRLPWMLIPLAAAVIFIVAGVDWKPTADLEFLTGRKPISREFITGPPDLEILYYSFEGDFTDVARKASDELSRQGYVRAERSKDNVLVLEREFERDLVVIYRKSRYGNIRGPLWQIDSRWITVIVTRPEERTIFDRVRHWFGLQRILYPP